MNLRELYDEIMKDPDGLKYISRYLDRWHLDFSHDVEKYSSLNILGFKYCDKLTHTIRVYNGKIWDTVPLKKVLKKIKVFQKKHAHEVRARQQFLDGFLENIKKKIIEEGEKENE